ncbi:MAG: hypothetical protein Q4F06_07920 [Eubacteriales bacterium]|nr:hypothetical protein [Eubacteriales bacterium]
MRLFRKMFADKILRYYEGTNSGVRALGKVPVLKNHITEETFGEHSKLRAVVGITIQIFVILWEFIKRFMYVFALIYIPYRILGEFCPLVKANQELTIIFMFVMLSTICGSFANNTLFTIGDRDYLMIRIMLISPYLNFLGNLIYKMVTEFVFYLIILCIFGVSFPHSLMLCVLNMCARPIGEMFAILSFDHFSWIYDNKSVFNGTVMAACVLLAYGIPLFARRIAPEWIYAVHPFVVLIVFLAGAGAMYFLWWYKYYRKIIREAMHFKREG